MSKAMELTNKIRVSVIGALLVLFTGAMAVQANMGAAQNGVLPLLLTTTESSKETSAPEEGVIRTKVVGVNAEMIQGLQSDPAKGPTKFSVELFDGKQYLCEVESVVRPPGSSTIVRAHMVGESTSVMTLVGRANILVGSIQVQDKSYQIRRNEQGQHLLQEINPDLLPPD